ncbi:hypothetical protein [Thaumasiovibrio subtropicus]|uniref:hypothetical protein n=1 Tax=Thaumasiovibrio subtropicus TaxID=1891207 RepID=UPI000B362DB4|nr:hypothetical protein [Thaumasiovibrio subtropicus]
MKKLLLSASILAALSAAPVIAEDEMIDPSDLTRVYTQAAFFVTSDADVRMSSMFTGAWSENIQFAGFVEGNFGDASGKDGDNFGINYKNGRAQYFQVHTTNNAYMPRAGFMLDAIHFNVKGAEDAMLGSVGAIGLINPAFTGGAMVFPNANYTFGEIMGESVDGFMLNLFATIPLGDGGAFVQAWPEYMNVSGDNIKAESTTYNVMFNAPIKSNRSQWLMTKLAYGNQDMTLGGEKLEGDYELKAEIGVKWFF